MDSNSRYLQYSYDTTGKKTKTIYPEGSVVSYACDNAGRLATITNGGGKTYGYSCDKLGRRSKITYPSGATANYSYDTKGNLTSLIHKTSSNATIANYAYTHDKVGNRLSTTDSDTTAYQYDPVYRLLHALPVKPNGTTKTNGSGTEDYSYDPVGNRIIGPQAQNSYSYSAGNQLTTDSQLIYRFDNNGNLIAKGKPNTTSDNTNRWSYSYDLENRLIKAESKFDKENVVVTFKYDPLGRRIEKRIEDKNKKPEDATVITYVYDDQVIILQYEVTPQKATTTKYVHGPNIDEPLSMQRGMDVYYYHADGLGSITVLTDSKQKVVESYRYDSFGNLKNGIKPKQPFTYTSRIWDMEIGLYDYRTRTYNSQLGRFIQKDPIGFDGGDVNLYGYVQNNPINWIDPWGLFRYTPTAGGPVNNTTASSLTCFERCAGHEVTVTAGQEGGHSRGSAHETGQACDVGKNSNPWLDRDTSQSCFQQCFDQSRSFGQEEGNHYHFQTRPGRGGATGFADGLR